MFSISFGEMMVILIMGLLVIGPKRLPAAARFIGHLFGRIQRQVASVKSDIKREMDMAELREMQEGYRKAAQDVTRAMNSPVDKPPDTDKATLETPAAGQAQKPQLSKAPAQPS